MTDAPDGARPFLLKDRPLTFAGKNFTLRYSVIAMCALKERWRITTDKDLGKRLGQQQATDVPAVLWACMQTHHPDVRYSDVLRMCDDVNAAGETEKIGAAYTVCVESMRAGQPEPTEKKPEEATGKKGK